MSSPSIEHCERMSNPADKRPCMFVREEGDNYSLDLQFARWKPLHDVTRARLSRIVAKLLTEINKQEGE